MSLRVIGDVHAQVDTVFGRGKPTYLELVAGCEYSLQIGDMGDGETYSELDEFVDVQRHRFFPGNHDHYNCLPAHSLGDFGSVTHGGVDFFFVRGAASTDKTKLLQTEKRVGRQLWFENEELSDQQMSDAKVEYASAKPRIMMSHDAPSRIAQFVCEDISRSRQPFQESRTSEFLESLLEIHRPELWLFGHCHQDWTYREEGTKFRCIGELSFVDIDDAGIVDSEG